MDEGRKRPFGLLATGGAVLLLLVALGVTIPVLFLRQRQDETTQTFPGSPETLGPEGASLTPTRSPKFPTSLPSTTPSALTPTVQPSNGPSATRLRLETTEELRLAVDQFFSSDETQDEE